MNKKEQLELLKKIENCKFGFVYKGLIFFDKGKASSFEAELSIDEVLKIVEIGEDKFNANNLNVSLEDYLDYKKQYFDFGNSCMAITKKGKQCKNFSYKVTDINEYLKLRNNKEFFCDYHNKNYSKDI